MLLVAGNNGEGEAGDLRAAFHRLLLMLEMVDTNTDGMIFMNTNYIARPRPKGYKGADKFPLVNQKIR